MSLEKEAKVSILEAGIADVSTYFTFSFWFEANQTSTWLVKQNVTGVSNPNEMYEGALITYCC